MKFEEAKGHRDWWGQNAILRNHIRDTLRHVFEKYGYDPLETPLLENQSTIEFKGGGEIQKEVYKLRDQGQRKLAMRFDQTLPLARFMATHQEVKLPFKRYAIGPVFRDGPTQPDQGRFRSFTQCDVDVLGNPGMDAEAELFDLARNAFQDLGLGDVEVKINNRKLLDGILEYAGVPEIAKIRTIVTLDKMDKIGRDGVKDQLYQLKLSDEFAGDGNENSNALLDANVVDKLMEALIIDTNEVTQKHLGKIIESEKGILGLAEVSQLLGYSKAMGLDSIQFDPSLARGLDYYTGTTIEVYLKDRTIVNSAILAGGRFDDMVGDFRGGQEIPAVGFSFGLERLAMVLSHENEALPKTNTELYIIPMDTMQTVLEYAHHLRGENINVDIGINRKKVGKNIGFASERGIPYVGIVGEEEVQSNTLKIKNLGTGEQKSLKLNEVKEYIQNAT